MINEPYGSAIATTVLQYKETPPRTVDYDGAVAIFAPNVAPKEHLDEDRIRSVLAKAGPITKVEKRPWPPWVVYFATHADALKAIEQFAKSKAELWENLDFLYNERPYDERGW